MPIDRVTITGADDSIDPIRLLPLSNEFPFVEWGILASKAHEAEPRFPSRHWIEFLQANSVLSLNPMQLSLHLCGKYVRKLLVGKNIIPAWLLTEMSRVQLNFHDEYMKFKPEKFYEAVSGLKRPIILQIDGNSGATYMEAYCDAGGCPMPLFDTSGGVGVTPAEWDTRAWKNEDTYLYHGYAGGLGPDNLEEQINRILAIAPPAPIWIDMETNVRSNDNSKFDLEKVRRCLEIAKPYVNPS